jgi:hypothetical protein
MASRRAKTMKGTSKFEIRQILRSIAILFPGDDIIELRVPKADKTGTISGYYQDRKALVKAILSVARVGYAGIYWTLNPVMRDLLARASNRLRRWARQTTGDKEITVVQRLLVDLDPVRPSGISSTEDELQAAVHKAAAVQAYLADHGWPKPVVAMSGNGMHLLYRTPDLPNCAETTDLLRQCLRALSARFSDATVQVDESTYNASRIVKVYGTMACKGDATESRPHRMARLLEVPKPWIAVERAVMEQLAAEVQTQGSAGPRIQDRDHQVAGNVGLNQALETWMAAHGLEIAKGPEPYQGAWRWRLKVCPFDANHNGTSAAIFLSTAGRPGYRCLHRGCNGKRFGDLARYLGDPRLELTEQRISALSRSEDRDADNSPLPNIRINDRELRDLRADCVVALNRTNNPPYIYMRGGIPAYIVADETHALSIKPVSPDVMANFLTNQANFHRKVPMAPAVRVPPPTEAIKAVLASSAAELGFPSLEEIIHAPSLREDGSVIDTPGYDIRSRLYYTPAPDLCVPEIPDCPREDQVSSALDLIKDLLTDFPFTGEASLAHAIAALMTPVLRAGIAGAVPVAIIDASVSGSGKSLLADVISIIATGKPAPMFSVPKNSEEWRKQFTAIVLAGMPYAVFDNLNHRLDSGEFCKVVTEARHADRILGVSKLVDMPARTTWAVTGNNVQLGGDMPRRCYWMRIEPPCADPFMRTGFKHADLKQHTREHRGRLIAAILTLARAWYAAGRPSHGVPVLGGFEGWSKMMGGILHCAKVEGFLANAKKLFWESDDEGWEWEIFFRLLRRIFSDDFTVAQIWSRLHQSDDREADVRGSELREAVPTCLKADIDRGEGAFNQRLGTRFRELLARRFGATGIRLERVEDDKHNKVARWRLVADGDIDSPERSR